LFRTYPKGYKPPDEEPSEYQTIPLNKIEDFGVHCKQYYSLDVQYFKSAMDKVCPSFCYLRTVLWPGFIESGYGFESSISVESGSGYGSSV
jgi:hypothetical protein